MLLQGVARVYTNRTRPVFLKLELPKDIIQMLRESVVPTKDNQSWVLEAIQDCEKRVAELAQSSSSAPNLPEVQRHQWKLSALQSLFAPIRRLPSEILVHIFQLYLSTKAGGSGTRLVSERSPLVLCGVCCSWRATVHSAAALWTRLKINAHGDCYASSSVRAGKLDGIRTWMDRVGQQPWSLSIELDLPAAGCRDGRVALSTVLDHPAVTRLRRLRIDAEASITGVEKQKFPSLESLVVRWRHADYHMHFFESVFPDVPNLKKLVAVNVTTLNTVTDKLPWSNLTQLFVEGITLSKWRSIIGHCTSLQDGCFSLTEPSQHIEEFVPSGSSPPEPVNLPHLTRLTFLNRPPLHHDLREMMFPALEELNIFHGDWALGSWNVHTLRAFHSVTRLTIVGRRYVELEDNIFRLLEETPYVTEFALDIQCDIESLLQSLTHRRDRAHLVSLEKLDIFCSTFSPEEDTSRASSPSHSPFFMDSLRSMLRSRAPTSNSPTHIHPAPVLTSLKVRLPEAPWSAQTVLAIEDICSDVGLGNAEIVIIDQSRIPAIPSMSILGDESNGHEHWGDGLMDFLHRP